MPIAAHKYFLSNNPAQIRRVIIGQCQKPKTLYYPFSYANLASFLVSRDIYHMYLLHLPREHLKVGTTSCLRFQSMGTP